MDKSDRVRKTWNVEPELVQRIGKLQGEAKDQELGLTSESDIVNAALRLGLTALPILNEEMPTARSVERRSAVDTAVKQHFREHDGGLLRVDGETYRPEDVRDLLDD